MNEINQLVEELLCDRMTLTLRLICEPEDSHAPETLEVLDRMRPEAMAMIESGITPQEYAKSFMRGPVRESAIVGAV